MKKIISLLVLAILISACSKISSPEIIYSSSNKIFVADKSQKKVLVLDKNLNVKEEIKFNNPVSFIGECNGNLVVLTKGVIGEMKIYDLKSLKEIKTIALGYDPSSVLYNNLTNSYWVSNRYNNQVWELSEEGDVISKVDVGREPIDMTFSKDSATLIVVNNLPSQAANSNYVASEVTLVDCMKKQKSGVISLPGGSTDIRAIIVDKDNRYAYIPHTLARYQIPTNQVERGWMTTSVVSIIDLDSLNYINSVIVDTPQRGAPSLYKGVVSNCGEWLFLPVMGTGEVVTIALNSLHERLNRAAQGEQVTPSVNSYKSIPNDAGFLFGIRDFIDTKGKGTKSLSIFKGNLLGVNYFTGELFTIDLNSDFLNIPNNNINRAKMLKHDNVEVSKVIKLGKPLTSTSKGRGELYFNDASLTFQQWQSCATCHPNDARTDGLNWDLLNDGPASLKQTKSLLYSIETSPAMITGIRKDGKTAVRSGFKHIAFSSISEDMYEDVDNYLASLEPLPSPYLIEGELSEKADQGKIIFDKECLSCHNGKYYTDQKLYNIEWAIGRDKDVKMDTPTLVELWRTAPYLYDGRAVTFEEMMEYHLPDLKLSGTESDQLKEYVMSL